MTMSLTSSSVSSKRSAIEVTKFSARMVSIFAILYFCKSADSGSEIEFRFCRDGGLGESAGFSSSDWTGVADCADGMTGVV